jgi:predicted RNA-binding protein with TRAM domain
VEVVAVNASGSGVAARSGATSVIGSGVPVLTLAPSISGSPVVGGVLTATSGSWSGSPSNFWLVWQRCDASGAGCVPTAAGQNYAWGATVSRTLTAADAGKTFRVEVVAVNASGSGVAARSGATSVIGSGVPVLTLAPSISGSPVVGGVLTATSGSWSASPSNFWLVWQRCDAAGAGCVSVGAGQNYPWGSTVSRTLTADDAGKTFRVQVVAVNGSGSGVAAVSGATSVIGSGVPVLTAAPSIGGSPVVGGVLTATSGWWSGSPSNFWLVWLRCDAAGNACSTVGTSTNYQWGTTVTRTMTSADVGKTFRVQVVAVNASGSGVAARSGATSVIGSGVPVLTLAPSIGGSPVVGSLLTATSGSWSGSPSNFWLVWLRCDSAGNACSTVGTSTNYQWGAVASRMLTSADLGKTLRVQVVAVNSIGSGVAARSAASSIIAPRPVKPTVVTAPTLIGTSRPGEPLSTSSGVYAGVGITKSYAWYRCHRTDNNICDQIPGASNSSYVPTYGDTGARIRVTVTASNVAGFVTTTRFSKIIASTENNCWDMKPDMASLSRRIGSVEVGRLSSGFVSMRLCYDAVSNTYVPPGGGIIVLSSTVENVGVGGLLLHEGWEHPEPTYSSFLDRWGRKVIHHTATATEKFSCALLDIALRVIDQLPSHAARALTSVCDLVDAFAMDYNLGWLIAPGGLSLSTATLAWKVDQGDALRILLDLFTSDPHVPFVGLSDKTPPECYPDSNGGFDFAACRDAIVRRETIGRWP